MRGKSCSARPQPRALQRYLAAREFSCQYPLCCSDCEPLGMSELVQMCAEDGEVMEMCVSPPASRLGAACQGSERRAGHLFEVSAQRAYSAAHASTLAPSASAPQPHIPHLQVGRHIAGVHRTARSPGATQARCCAQSEPVV